jgi:hypothetical protein
MLGTGVVATPADGTVFVIAGSAGASLYPNGMDYWTEYSEQTQNYALLRARAGMLDFQAFREDGSLMDSFTITK